MSVEEYFATGPPHERPVFDAVVAHLDALGPVDVEPVSVGVLLKREGRRFADLRPMQRWVAISFSLRRRVQHRTITRKVIPYNGRFWHVANVRGPDDLDDELLGHLAESYDDA